jgi:hypothetical protein
LTSPGQRTPTATPILSSIAQHPAGPSGHTAVMTKAAATTSRDQDIHKGAVEDEAAGKATNAPALDANGLPNDKKKIAEDALGAREDKTTG